VLVLPKLSFDDFIRHQFQALIFGYLFIKKKRRAVRRSAEASQAHREKSPNPAIGTIFQRRLLQQMKDLLRNDGCFEGMY